MHGMTLTMPDLIRLCCIGLLRYNVVEAETYKKSIYKHIKNILKTNNAKLFTVCTHLTNRAYVLQGYVL